MFVGAEKGYPIFKILSLKGTPWLVGRSENDRCKKKQPAEYLVKVDLNTKQ
jgi:hypothetical protein